MPDLDLWLPEKVDAVLGGARVGVEQGQERSVSGLGEKQIRTGTGRIGKAGLWGILYPFPEPSPSPPWTSWIYAGYIAVRALANIGPWKAMWEIKEIKKIVMQCV